MLDPDISVRVYNHSIRRRRVIKIGELSRLSGVSVRSLRYYEQQGLIISERLVNGYREYHNLAVEQVKTIAFYLSLGLSTAQISSFLQCVLTNKEAFCREIMPIYMSKLEEIEHQLNTLTQLKSNLEERIRYMLQENPQLQPKLTEHMLTKQVSLKEE